MAKRKNTKPTTRTTITRSRKGQTTRTTTTKSTYRPGARMAARARRTPTKTITNTYVTKTGNGAAILGVIVVLLLVGAIAYLLMNPTVITYLVASIATPAQQHSQFADQLSRMQSNNQNLTLFYLAAAPNYNLPVNKSWSVQVTDRNPSNNTPIGQLTMSWDGQSRSLSMLNGIVNTGISPTYAVTLSHPEFMSFSQAVITRNTGAALADYSTYFLSGKLNYTQVQ